MDRCPPFYPALAGDLSMTAPTLHRAAGGFPASLPDHEAGGL